VQSAKDLYKANYLCSCGAGAPPANCVELSNCMQENSLRSINPRTAASGTYARLA